MIIAGAGAPALLPIDRQAPRLVAVVILAGAEAPALPTGIPAAAQRRQL